MINLVLFREYWDGIAARIPEITGVLPVTVDKDMVKKIQGIATGSITLFFVPPTAQSETKSADSWQERNECVVFVMEKYDPQRKTSFAVLESTQPVIEDVKSLLLNDLTASCPLLNIDVTTLNTVPETEFFAGFAGWSLGFRIKTY